MTNKIWAEIISAKLRYVVVHDKELDEFEDLVIQFILAGYTLVGGISIKWTEAIASDGEVIDVLHYYQALGYLTIED